MTLGELIISLMGSLILCLVLTIIIETICALPLLKWKKWEKSNFIDLLLINCLTNPIVVTISNILLWYHYNFHYAGAARVDTEYMLQIMFIVELLVVFVEGWLLRKFNFKLGKKAYLIALYINAISYLSSFVVF